MPFKAKCWLLLTVVSCHIRLIFLAYLGSTLRHERVGANRLWFGVITKELLTIEVEGKIVKFLFYGMLQIFGAKSSYATCVAQI